MAIGGNNEMNDKLSDKRVKFSIGYVIAAILIMMLIQQFMVRPLRRLGLAQSEPAREENS